MIVCVGIDVETYEVLWTRYLKDTKFTQLELLWTLTFLRTYDTFDQLSCFWNCNKGMYEKTIWDLIKHLYYYLDEIDSSVRFQEEYQYMGSFYSRVVTDCTECLLEKPTNKEENFRCYSGYKKRTTLKYFTIVLSTKPILVECDGPYYGKEDDLTVTIRSGILDEYVGQEHIMADQKNMLV